ncbi:YIP1 family protein [Leptonema illini]|uniref:Yip1 domain-containing protein n=1 Tax=Leptonema illini DSM 21528 TaxID=929563 RepID=H2CKQ1_9LEPT|nr:YIP1 family protein [Leptonema illini]EHQ05106.1 hypothetical protein Lepil_0400 [Leptonema illini DSM 21528]
MIEQIEQMLQRRYIPSVLAESTTRILQLRRSPSTFFAENQKNHRFFVQALKDSLLLWTAITIMLFVVTVINLNAIRLSNLAFSSLTGTAPHANAYLPWSQLAFPIFWSVAPLTIGSIRHLFLIMLGENERSIQKTQALALYAALPFALATGISAILGAAFPCVPRPGSGFFSCPMLLIGSVLIITGGCIDALFWLKGLRTLYQQNIGRAILTYISPLILFMLSTFAVYSSASMLLLLRP